MNFWIQIAAAIYVLTGSKMVWVVTAKQSTKQREPGSVVPALTVLGILAVTALRDGHHRAHPCGPQHLSFAAMYAVILLVGIWPACLAGNPAASVTQPDDDLDLDRLDETEVHPAPELV